MADIPIIPLSRLDLRFEPAPWPFADERRTEIDAHFAKLRGREAGNVERPRAVAAARRHRRRRAQRRLSGNRFRELHRLARLGLSRQDDPQLLSAWRRCARPMARSCSASWAVTRRLRGKIYFPAGTPDPNDIVGDTVDLERGVMRELTEETGLGVADVVRGARMVCDAARPAPRADEGRAGARKCRRAARAHPRISRPPGAARAVGHSCGAQPGRFRPTMPPYVAAFLASRLR